MPSMSPQPQRRPARILIIDNYDSYTFNLFQFCTIDPEYPPIVIRNDQLKWEELRDTVLPYVDAVVVSPGPGRPDRDEDFGVCANVIRHAHVPILGVCLGHQGLASVFGGKVVTADPPMHGRLSDVHHTGTDLFKGLPSPFRVVRYHSLVVDPQHLPDVLEQTAWTYPSDSDHHTQRIVMALRHRSRPIWSVQFHPESICTEYGQKMIHNFISLAQAYWQKHPDRQTITIPNVIHNAHIESITVLPQPLSTRPIGSFGYTVLACPIPNVFVSPSRVYEQAFSQCEQAFWLDSARVENGLSRHSYMGDASGPFGFDVKYSLATRTLSQRRGTKTLLETVIPKQDTFFAWVSDHMRGATVPHDRIEVIVSSIHAGDTDRNQHQSHHDATTYPFMCGFVGYFGYEMKSESLRLHMADRDDLNRFGVGSAGSIPDAAFLFSDRVIAFDHLEQRVCVFAIVGDDDQVDTRSAQLAWIDETVRVLCGMANDDVVSSAQPNNARDQRGSTPATTTKPVSEWMTLSHDRRSYLTNIKSSLERIHQGETYEVCLTTQLTRRLGHLDRRKPFDFYQHLRTRNPAPYGAFLSLGEGLYLASSSPERFLRLDADRWVSMKPIKGTRPRAISSCPGVSGDDVLSRLEDDRRRVDLETNEKDRSENLMIVDLIRNDLNQICVPQSVCVPHLMVVESYATVHQLVSTIKGKLRDELIAVDAAMRSFPPGSMTGAPKLRTVHILEDLEGIPRGPYSGVLGFFSVTGPADLSVVIRTAILSRNESGTTVSIGAGGAIVALSDPTDEFDEMLLKANSVVPSLAAVFT